MKIKRRVKRVITAMLTIVLSCTTLLFCPINAKTNIMSVPNTFISLYEKRGDSYVTYQLSSTLNNTSSSVHDALENNYLVSVGKYGSWNNTYDILNLQFNFDSTFGTGNGNACMIGISTAVGTDIFSGSIIKDIYIHCDSTLIKRDFDNNMHGIEAVHATGYFQRSNVTYIIFPNSYFFNDGQVTMSIILYPEATGYLKFAGDLCATNFRVKADQSLTMATIIAVQEVYNSLGDGISVNLDDVQLTVDNTDIINKLSEIQSLIDTNSALYNQIQIIRNNLTDISKYSFDIKNKLFDLYNLLNNYAQEQEQKLHDLDDKTDEFIDITTEINDIESGYSNQLVDFSTNTNLEDYNFVTGLFDTSNYFKDKLQIIHVQGTQNGISAIWVIPVILVILGALLGG